MTWSGFNNTRKNLVGAAVFAALSVFAAPTSAQDINLRTGDGGLELSGRFLAYDGALITLATENGIVSLRFDGMTCEGSACPGRGYAPTLRLVGPPEIVDLLLPALVDAYARELGYSVDAGDAVVAVKNGDRTIFRLEFRSMTMNGGLDAFLTHEADALIATRPLSAEEAQQVRETGMGDLDSPRQSQLIALEAMVPVMAAGGDRLTVSLAELAAILSGQRTRWPGAEARAIRVHLMGPEHGWTDAVVARLLDDKDRVPNITWHARAQGLEAALAGDPAAMGLLPVSQVAVSQPLSLRGRCGLTLAARPLSIKTEDYPLTVPLTLHLPPWRLHPALRDFLNWTRGAQAQLVVRRAGLVDLGGVPIPLSMQGDRLANAISNAGSEVPLAELQRMVRVLTPRVRISSTFRFEPGSTRLDGASRSNVLQLAQAIQDGRFAGREMMLIGFSDGRGPAAANRDISFARADGVKADILQALGGDLPYNVALETEAFGEAMPIACDETQWGQEANRRVELWVRDLN